MFPNLCIFARRNQNIYIWRVGVETVIHLAFIVCAICCKIEDGLLNLLQQATHGFIIADAVFGQEHGLNFAIFRFAATGSLRQVRRLSSENFIGPLIATPCAS